MLRPHPRLRSSDPFRAPQRWLVRLGSRFYYPIAAVAVILIIGLVVRSALLGNDELRRLADLVLIGGVCALVIFWRSERMWLRGQVNWLVQSIHPDRAFFWTGIVVMGIALGLVGFIKITGSDSTAANHLWPLFLFPLLFLAERGETLPFLFILGLACVLLTLLRLAVSNSFSGALTPPLWLATLATSNYYLARRHLLLELRTDLLRQIANQFSNTPNIETSFEAVVEVIGYRLRHDHVWLWLLDQSNERLTLHAARGTSKEKWEGASLPTSNGIPGSVIRSGQPERWDDVKRCPHHHSQPAFEWIRSELAVPIIVAGQAIGVLEVLSPNTAEFWELDEEQLTLMADSIGIALARSQHVRREAERLRDLLWLAVSRLSDCASIQEMFDEIAREAQEHLGADLVMLYQLAPGTGYPLAPPLFMGNFHNPETLSEPSIPPGSALFDLLKKWEPHYSPEAASDPIFDQNGAASTDDGRVRLVPRESLRSIVFLPLGSPDERVGALFLLYRSRREFSPLDKLSLEAFAGLVAEQINRERAHWRKYEAFGGVMFGVHGPLTLSADSLRRLIGSALEVMRTDPTTAEAALEHAQAVARKLEMAAMLTRLAKRDELEAATIEEELRRAAAKIVQFVEPNCRVFTDIPPEADDLPFEVLDAVYCLAMEAVVNAAVHGHARRIDIALELDETAIRLLVTDNGQGFDPAQARHGPNGIFEGLELVQQQFAAQGKMESQLGAGARMEVVFPALDLTDVQA